MQYQSDYIMRLIEQVGGLMRRAVEVFRDGSDDQSYELTDEAIGLIFDMDPAVATRLSPQSLASLVEMRNVDDRIIEVVADALDLQRSVLERNGEIVGARVRKEQADAIRALLDPNRAN